MSRMATGSVLHRLLLGHQEELACALGARRASIDHPGLKGGASEEQWRAALSTYLPQRYRVTTGVVVDCLGNQSRQIDIIIHDAHYCPLFRDVGSLSFVPAESVYAVIEVKQTVDSVTLADAAVKAESVRRLKRTSAPIVERGRRKPPRKIPPILAGIVGLTSGWTNGLGAGFRRELARHSGRKAINVGCAIDAGAFEIPRRGSAASVQLLPDSVALVAFFLALVRRLQSLGTVPAIDWRKYEAAFSEIARG